MTTLADFVSDEIVIARALIVAARAIGGYDVAILVACRQARGLASIESAIESAYVQAQQPRDPTVTADRVADCIRHLLVQ